MNGPSPVLYFPHGGGPMPLLGDVGHEHMIDFLRAITPALGTPAAILVISAHWEATVPTLTSGDSPSLLYDYSGFPQESYAITYPAPGDPVLARDVYQLLRAGGLEARLDDQRGFDHGLFVPLKIMYPAADIPCVQLSLVSGLDSESHLRIGRALLELREQNVLVVGSGFSFHNMRAFDFSGHAAPDPQNDAFQDWLTDTCTNRAITREERERRLAQWAHAPSARYCHPREEHLLPLHVCCGAAGTAAKVVFDGYVLGKRSVALLW